jgi:hypothetical protein
MRTLFFALIAVFLFSGCGKYFDEENPVGGGYARTKAQKRDVFARTVNLTPGAGLDSAYSRLYENIWSPNGQCRTGYFHHDTFYAYLEFCIANIPGDFDTLGDLTGPDTLDLLHGIDFIRIRFNLESDSWLAHDTIDQQIIFYACEKKSKATSSSTVEYLDIFNPLDTMRFYLPDTGATEAIPADTCATEAISVDVLLDSSQALFNYIRQAVFERAGDTAVIPLAFKMQGSGRDAILTFKSNDPPIMTLFGQYRPLYQAWTGDSLITWHDDMLKVDSVSSSIKIMDYVSIRTDSGRFLIDPMVSTVHYQRSDINTEASGTAAADTATPAGHAQAVFQVKVNTIFTGLNPDSINMVGAVATFFNKADSSYSEGDQAIDLRLFCQLVSHGDTGVPDDDVFYPQDTIVKNFSPCDSLRLRFPIDKYLAVLTDSRYRDVQYLLFTIMHYHGSSASTSLNRMSRVVFSKEVRLDFEYSER